MGSYWNKQLLLVIIVVDIIHLFKKIYTPTWFQGNDILLEVYFILRFIDFSLKIYIGYIPPSTSTNFPELVPSSSNVV